MHALENLLPTVYIAFYLILSTLRIQEKIAKYNNSCRIFNVITKNVVFVLLIPFVKMFEICLKIFCENVFDYL